MKETDQLPNEKDSKIFLNFTQENDKFVEFEILSIEEESENQESES